MGKEVLMHGLSAHPSICTLLIIFYLSFVYFFYCIFQLLQSQNTLVCMSESRNNMTDLACVVCA